MKPFRIPLAAALVLAVPLACPAERVKLPNDIHWVGAADTFKACCQQAYANAGLRLRELAKAEKPGTWCVVLDADETIICNVEFQKEITVTGTGHSSGASGCMVQPRRGDRPPRGEGVLRPRARARRQGGHHHQPRGPHQGGHDQEPRRPRLRRRRRADARGPIRPGPKKTARRNDVEKGEVKTLPEGTSLPPLKILMPAAIRSTTCTTKARSRSSRRRTASAATGHRPQPDVRGLDEEGGVRRGPVGEEAAEPAVSSRLRGADPAQAGEDGRDGGRRGHGLRRARAHARPRLPALPRGRTGTG